MLRRPLLNISPEAGNKEDGRTLFADQRDGAVLHLGGRVALGVHVGDFLELQGAFEGDRERKKRPAGRGKAMSW